MIKFQTYAEQQLAEKLITFGGKAYPKFGQVVIIAGGAGSGKGFAIENLLGIDGRVMDVDAVKKLAMNSDKLAKKIKDETGQDIKSFNLKNPANVAKIHELLSDMYGVTKGVERNLLASALLADADRKPNIIFDVTMKDMAKLEKISRNVTEIGYDKSNIHIVWVVNDVNIAIQQNKTRSRVVPEEILLATHEGASLTMRKIVDADTKLSRYMDGDIWFTFNKADIDTFMKKSGRGGSYIIGADYIQIKKKGRKPMDIKDIGEFMLRKISDYTPKLKDWLTDTGE